MRLGKVEELIDLITDELEVKLNYAQLHDVYGISKKESYILYNDVKFKVSEFHTYDIMNGHDVNRMMIEVPTNVDYTWPYVQVGWETGYNHTSAIDNRRRACYKLAETFVKEVLPKVDFKIKKELYNNEIDRILSVLD